ncbi:CIA30 family protein [Prochlorococcus sp. MIT 1300]|uniref:CIA30 family protein n=1 Tax=Prochlorococcus sp. MIT 1300 TaxID=3096218 RepID=UPI002A75A8D0|nr:CIA30 family protein [Prochlorococcus sp. MIT 1300]
MVLFDVNRFNAWTSLNDSIMGGSSEATCHVCEDGLLLEGELIEDGGGFVSCKSPLILPPLNLSSYRALQLEVDGEGRTLKLALACRDKFFGLSELIQGGIRWIASVPTNSKGTTNFQVPFSSLEPTIRAKPVNFPVSFNKSTITQLQLLHSKFGQPGELNEGFRAGPIRILIRSISAIH